MKILLIGSQHGNELLGEQLYDYIKQNRPTLLPHVTYLVGNIRAHRKNIRYIESDLNRSYQGTGATYEERRASRILSFIKKGGYDFVLDLHTTTCIEPPCIIIPKVAPENVRFLRASSIKNIVEMASPIVETSLIGVCPHSVCIEVNKDDIDDTMLDGICDDIERYMAEEMLHQQKDIYKVDGPLKKSEISNEDAESLRNFELSPFGFYPILVGENSYKKQTNYLGFKAYDRHSSKV